MKMIIRRSSIKILIGLALLLGVLFTVSLFISGFKYWVFIVNNFFILVAILFSDDIRNVLYRIGLTVEAVFKKLAFMKKRGRYTLTTNSTVDEVAQACFKMAKERTGALICFQKAHSLEEFQTSGTVINANNISCELLMTIFAKNTPLHDGAVIVQNNRLLAAGCFLPSSEQTGLDKSYGARHRAAIGLTGSHDSVVILVSEERGAVYLVRNGKISEPMQSADKLVIRLHDALEQSEELN